MVISCESLRVCFSSGGTIAAALEDCSFVVRPHEFVAIVGPSGCGKTTLLRTIAGLIHPSSGAITTTLSGGMRSLLVFQENNLFPWMTAAENAAYGLRIAGVGTSERLERARLILDRLGLGGRLHAWPHELSLGMKQRVAVARAFLSNPGLLLMDEPFSGLDAETRSRLQLELLSLWENDRVPVVFVTHDVDEAILLSQRILVMTKGPGTILAELDVPFPYPRPFALTLTEEFLHLKRTVHRHLGVSWERVYAR